MNKCINPQRGLGNMGVNLCTGVYLSFPEKPEGRETIVPHQF